MDANYPRSKPWEGVGTILLATRNVYNTTLQNRSRFIACLIFRLARSYVSFCHIQSDPDIDDTIESFVHRSLEWVINGCHRWPESIFQPFSLFLSTRSRFGIGRARVNVEYGYTVWKKVIRKICICSLVTKLQITNIYLVLIRSNNAFLS